MFWNVSPGTANPFIFMKILNEHEVLDLTYINPYGERTALLFARGPSGG